MTTLGMTGARHGIEPADGFSSYDRKIPIIATGLRNLREYGPGGPVFRPFGRTHMRPLRDAIGTPAAMLPPPARRSG
ncbi:hypothetical protein ACFYRL_34055 [Streptomyces goshikiensis]|uniref:hypothetical protein n=1 Tax=Streptomyces goshikiensis TaxID=1942 RepID=UPI0036B05539